MNIKRIYPVFATAFCIFYAMAEPFKLQLFMYYPAVGKFSTEALTGVGPPINWYGWIAFAVLCAGVVSALMLCFPKSWSENKFWLTLSWVSPFMATLVLIYLARVWFV